jgi:hypothetical protein
MEEALRMKDTASSMKGASSQMDRAEPECMTCVKPEGSGKPSRSGTKTDGFDEGGSHADMAPPDSRSTE